MTEAEGDRASVMRDGSVMEESAEAEAEGDEDDDDEDDEDEAELGL